MKYLGIDSAELSQLGGIHTAAEICQQPVLWQKIWGEMNDNKQGIQNFLREALSGSKRIILTGAGTSAFIGLSLRGIMQRETGIVTEAIATTDIVSHPGDYFLEKQPLLMISFARSGNSPESVAAVKLADEICGTCYHLIITCNKDGKLAQYDAAEEKLVLTLPEEANDASLAMTSSYTGMLLAGLLVAKIEALDQVKEEIETVVEYAGKILFTYTDELKHIAKYNFNRAVFLGSGCFYGTAVEASLKLQELTDGKIICKKDSYLGFRHGPKAVIDEKTLVVYLLTSGNEYALKYEIDLIASMKKGTHPMLEVGISGSPIAGVQLSYLFHFSAIKKNITDEFLALCYILPAQIIGFYKSLELGLRPDAPSVNNDISRVVEGVEIYAY